MSVLGRALRDFPFSADGVTVEDVKKGTERPFPPQKVFDGLRDAGFIAAVAAFVAPPVDEAPAAPVAPIAPADEPQPAADTGARSAVDGGVAAAAASSEAWHDGAPVPEAPSDAATAVFELAADVAPIAPQTAPAAPAAEAPEAPTVAPAPAEPVVAPPEPAPTASSAAQKRRGRG